MQMASMNKVLNLTCAKWNTNYIYFEGSIFHLLHKNPIVWLTPSFGKPGGKKGHPFTADDSVNWPNL